jgi:hypothetical protein
MKTLFYLQPFTDDGGCDELVCWNFLQQLVVRGLVEEDQVIQLVAGLSLGPLLLLGLATSSLLLLGLLGGCLSILLCVFLGSL